MVDGYFQVCGNRRFINVYFGRYQGNSDNLHYWCNNSSSDIVPGSIFNKRYKKYKRKK